MAPPLDDYRKKRDFARTPEPSAAAGERGTEGRFVVHRHEARRLHYDLRLAEGGVLLCWAVPKGFSYEPKDKHLAVRTEDHPLEYEHFEGVIPKGEYGAGTMLVWDRGTYEVVQTEDIAGGIAKGEVKLILRGRRLRGEWHLVKTKQDEKSWLLFKSKDRYAGGAPGVDLSDALEAELPKRVTRMRAEAWPESFRDPDWIFEAEFEGRRAFLQKEGGSLRLRGLKRAVPELEVGAENLRAERALFDGVLVALDADGRPSRELLEERLAGRIEAPLSYYAFDLLYYEEFDLRGLPLVERKGLLRGVLPEGGAVLFVDHVPADGPGLEAAVGAAGLGGLLAKRAQSSYRAGSSKDWRRIPVSGEARRGVAVGEALAESHGERSAAASGRVKPTNLDKVFWPAEGYTKGDLLRWYETAADLLLPYLRDRPVHMLRYPDGIEGKSFYQKQANAVVPDWFETVAIQSGSKTEPVPYILCNDRDTLLALANLGSIDLHPWHSRQGSLEEPDWAVIDLDPKEAPFTDVVRIARTVGRLLRGVGLRPLLKTSGKTGLHVYVPLSEGYTYEHTRLFCEGVARLVVREHPDIATVERHVGSRAGKVYVDFLQNRREQTLVPPYAVRPVRGATVSAPLAWDELELDLTPARFTIQTMPERLARTGDLFRAALTDRQDLLAAIEALREMAGG